MRYTVSRRLRFLLFIGLGVLILANLAYAVRSFWHPEDVRLVFAAGLAATMLLAIASLNERDEWGGAITGFAIGLLGLSEALLWSGIALPGHTLAVGRVLCTLAWLLWCLGFSMEFPLQWERPNLSRFLLGTE